MNLSHKLARGQANLGLYGTKVAKSTSLPPKVIELSDLISQEIVNGTQAIDDSSEEDIVLSNALLLMKRLKEVAKDPFLETDAKISLLKELQSQYREPVSSQSDA